MVEWTEDQLKEYERRRGKQPEPRPVKLHKASDLSKAKVVVPASKPLTLNKTEAEFSQWLSQHTGYMVLAQRIKVRLADLTWYTPDFFCFCQDGVVRCYETKGFMRDDAAVKLKVAAEQYWFFKWFLVTRIPKKKGGGWNIKPINE